MATTQFIQQEITHRVQLHADDQQIHLRIFDPERKSFVDAPMYAPRIPIMAMLLLNAGQCRQILTTAVAWFQAKAETTRGYAYQ